MVTKTAMRDALELAHSMLSVIESGASFSSDAWWQRLAQIERALGKDTVRARYTPLSASEAQNGITRLGW